jgi:hypothetical protein
MGLVFVGIIRLLPFLLAIYAILFVVRLFRGRSTRRSKR